MRKRNVLTAVCIAILIDMIVVPNVKMAKLAGLPTVLQVGGYSVSISELLVLGYIGYLAMQPGWPPFRLGFPRFVRILFAAFLILFTVAMIRGAAVHGVVPMVKEVRLFGAFALGFFLARCKGPDLLAPLFSDGKRLVAYLCGLIILLHTFGRVARSAGIPWMASSWEVEYFILFFFVFLTLEQLTTKNSFLGGTLLSLAFIGVVLSLFKPIYLAVLAMAVLGLSGLRELHSRNSSEIVATGVVVALLSLLMLTTRDSLPERLTGDLDYFWNVRVLKRGAGAVGGDLSAGRFDIWRSAVEQTMGGSLMLGTGMGGQLFPDYVINQLGSDEQADEAKETHNLIVFIIFQMGFPAGVIAVVLLGYLALETQRSLRKLFRASDGRSLRQKAATAAFLLYFWGLVAASMVGLPLKQGRLAFLVGLCFAILLREIVARNLSAKLPSYDSRVARAIELQDAH